MMRPRGALCGCCENTLLWDVETVFLYGCWSEVDRSRLSSFFEGMPSVVILWNVAHVSIVVDIPINCCVRLLHLVPILLY